MVRQRSHKIQPDQQINWSHSELVTLISVTCSRAELPNIKNCEDSPPLLCTGGRQQHVERFMLTTRFSFIEKHSVGPASY